MYSETKIALLVLADKKNLNCGEVDRLSDNPEVLKSYFESHFSDSFENFLLQIPSIKERYPEEWEGWKEWGGVTVD